MVSSIPGYIPVQLKREPSLKEEIQLSQKSVAFFKPTLAFSLLSVRVAMQNCDASFGILAFALDINGGKS